MTITKDAAQQDKTQGKSPPERPHPSRAQSGRSQRPGGQPGKPNWRTVALPSEHGGWGIVLEPIALGLLVAPSVTGAFLALAVFGSFLARTPLKVVWKDLRRGQRYPRTELALRALALYIGLVVLGFAGAVATGGITPVLPLLAASPLTGVQLYFDLFSTGRRLLPELVGPVALASVAGGMALAAGWSWPAALALWAVPALRTMPTVLYVRARIRMARNIPASLVPPIAVHALAGVAGLALWQVGLIPGLAALGLVLLLGRTLYGLSPYRRPMTTKALGWSEVRLGIAYTLLSTAGYWLGL